MNSKIFGLSAILFLPFILLAGCERWQGAKGHVLDSETRKPIDSVYIHVIDIPKGIYSDSLGKFALLGHSISPLFSGPPIQMKFKKRGYDSLIVKGDGTDTQKVYLKKSKLPTAH